MAYGPVESVPRLTGCFRESEHGHLFEKEQTMPQNYIIDDEQLAALRAITERLQSGNDKERDEGHRLWLILNQIKEQKLERNG